VEKGDPIILPNLFWDNYHLTFDVRHGSQTVTYPLFTSTGTFHVEAMEEAMMQCGKSKLILVMNFPNNPTGYTPYEEEVAKIIEAIIRVANSGINLVVVADDAYFGQFYEDSIKESIFSRLVGVHPRVLPIKVDGATKEEYAWGFRVGFLTFGIQNPEVLEALEEKTLASIRSTISCCPHPSQTFILDVLQHPNFEVQRKDHFQVMKSRWQRIKEIVSSKKYTDAFEAYPFNSGYFVCLRIKQVDAESLRKYLIDQYGVGTISFGQQNLRIAFSSVEVEDLQQLFECIYQACKELETNLVKL
jgi:aspartate/methionine/tyrosine aminotransferase